MRSCVGYGWTDSVGPRFSLDDKIDSVSASHTVSCSASVDLCFESVLPGPSSLWGSLVTYLAVPYCCGADRLTVTGSIPRVRRCEAWYGRPGRTIDGRRQLQVRGCRGSVACQPIASSLRGPTRDDDDDGGVGDSDGREIEKKSTAQGVHVRNKSVSGTCPLQLASW